MHPTTNGAMEAQSECVHITRLHVSGSLGPGLYYAQWMLINKFSANFRKFTKSPLLVGHAQMSRSVKSGGRCLRTVQSTFQMQQVDGMTFHLGRTFNVARVFPEEQLLI